MPFTAQELENIANAALDFYVKGKVFSQSIQKKPILRQMERRKKTFPSGKEVISIGVKGVYTTQIVGYEHLDDLSVNPLGFQNPANIKRAVYPWKEVHAGLEISMSELKKDGISVVDTNGERTTMSAGREQTALANLLDDKTEDMGEGWNRGFETMYLLDGTQDAKLSPGIKSVVLDNPAAAVTVGGIDQAANTWWRNRANLALQSLTGWADVANNSLINFLVSELRQLRRYGPGPDFAPAGSDFLDRLEREMRAKGTYTLDGWYKNGGTIDVGMADPALKGLKFEYEPELDDQGEAKRTYLLDTKNIFPMVMEGEDKKQHSPARPHGIYAIYRAMTWTGGLVARQRNTSGVYGFV